MDIVQQGGQAVLGFVAAYPYLALFALVLLEEAGLPLPISGDLLLVYSGYLVSQGQVEPLPIVAVVLGGAALGALLPYSLARAGGLRLVRRFGRVIRLSEPRLARVEGWLGRHRGRAIVLGRQVPGGRVPTSVVAGVFRVPLGAFIVYTALGSLLWSGAFMLLGARFGGELGALAHSAQATWLVAAAAIGLALYMWVRCIRRATS